MQSGMLWDSPRDYESYRRFFRQTLRSLHMRPELETPRGADGRQSLDKFMTVLLFRYLYYFLSDAGKLLPELFPVAAAIVDGPGKLPTTLEELYQLDMDDLSLTAGAFYDKLDKNAKENSHRHAGRSCGGKFMAGEPIYRCEECGYDDTCVLCIHCFNPKDHIDHHVYTKICTDSTSGICDCGDNEAWKEPLRCLADENEHDTPSNNKTKVDIGSQHVLTIFQIVLEEALDHLIDVFNQNIDVVPQIQKKITSKLKYCMENKEYFERARVLTDLAYRNEYMHVDSTAITRLEESGEIYQPETLFANAVDPQNYAVIVYNDEFHSYPEAIFGLRQGLPDNDNFNYLAKAIDKEGRTILKAGKDINELIGGFLSVQSNGLSATFTSWIEYIHQEQSKRIVEWIQHCLNLPNSNFQDHFREVLTKVLCSKSELAPHLRDMVPITKKYFMSGEDRHDIHRYVKFSILSDGNQIPLGYHKILSDTDMNIISSNVDRRRDIAFRSYTNSRLQHILYFDNRYWKALRLKLQNVIIPTLSSSKNYRQTFLEQFLEIFNLATYSVAETDREPHLTSMRECVVQLFTCPTNSKIILEKGYFEDIVWSVFDIFKKFTNIDEGVTVWQGVHICNPSKSYEVSFRQGLYAIKTVLSKTDSPNDFLKPTSFVPLVTLLMIFNGAWKVQRKEGEHVVNEDRSFIAYLDYTTSLYGMIRYVDKCLRQHSDSIDQQLLLHDIELLCRSLGHRSLTYKEVADAQDILRFTVSEERVSYMYPVHTLLSIMIDKLPLQIAFKGLRADEDFLKISDFPLRTIVLCAQAKIGFWVRNGMTMLDQLTYYKKNPEFDSYSRDIYVNQLSFLWEKSDKERKIYNMLDRWQLLEWYLGNVSFFDTAYEDKMPAIVREFITFNYYMLTERYFFQNNSQITSYTDYHLKRAVIYHLYPKPLSYSKLLKAIPAYLINDSSQLDNILSEVAEFVKPQGLAGSGTFQLKNEVYSKLDPLSLANMENDLESSTIAILNRGSKKSTRGKKNILYPQIVPPSQLDPWAVELGDFMKTSLFTKLIYKLLQEAITNDNGTFLYELLHMIHAIFIDEEQLRGKDALPNAYLLIPICNQLLTILNSKSEAFSDFAIYKADYLLQEIISKKPTEICDSLVSSFGEEVIEEYKKSKLEETQSVRKTEQDKKRIMAKKRQQKLMAKFSNQQEKFMKEHQAELAPKDSSAMSAEDNMGKETNKTTTEEDFICALCQDETSEDIFVVPAYHDFSPVFRSADIFDVRQLDTKFGFYNQSENLLFTHDSTLQDLRDGGRIGSRQVFVSCNHTIHHNCFRRYIQKKRLSPVAFICPLCQTYSNCVFPVHATSNTSLDINLKQLLHDPGSFHKLVSQLGTLSTADFRNIYTTLGLIVLESRAFDKSVYRRSGFEDKNASHIIATHWANTICTLEIESRLDNNSHVSFLQGREQKYQTLKNILVSILLLCYCVGYPDEDFNPYNDKAGKIWNQNQLFQYIVQQVLFKSKSLKDTLTSALTCFAKQFILDFSRGILTRNYYKMADKLKESEKFYIASPDVKLILERTFCTTDTNPDDLETVCNVLYSCLLEHLMPSMKRSLILLKVLHGLASGSEKEPIVVDEALLEDTLDVGDTPTYVDTVLRFLCRVTSLGELLVLKQNSDDETTIEPSLKDIPYEYCGLIKMTNLPNHLNTYITNTKQLRLREEYSKDLTNIGTRLDFKICLMCGVKIHMRNDHKEMSKHLSKYCFKPFGAFLIPNTGEVCLYLSQPRSTLYIPAPYLNSHGETGRNAMRRGNITTLNLKRYEHMNRLWINNEIPGYISRMMGDQFRVNMLANGFLFTFGRQGDGNNGTPNMNLDDLAFNTDDEIPLTGNGFNGQDVGDNDEDDDTDMGVGFNMNNGLPGNGLFNINIAGEEFLEVFQGLQNAMNNGFQIGNAPMMTAPFMRFLRRATDGRDPRRTVDLDDEVMDDESGNGLTNEGGTMEDILQEHDDVEEEQENSSDSGREEWFET